MVNEARGMHRLLQRQIREWDFGKKKSSKDDGQLIFRGQKRRSGRTWP